MTTAVYCHKTGQIAIDSRLSANERIISDSYNKTFERGDFVFFTSGSAHDLSEAVDLWFSISDKWKGSRFSILVVTPDNMVTCFYSHDGSAYRVQLSYNDAVGSGCDWALAALDFGCTAKAAVEYAKTKDAATGGIVRVYDINSRTWLL